MARRVFTVLENNPEAMNHLAHELGLSANLAFYDVYSLQDSELLALIPRPVHALIAIIPLTDSWNKARLAEDDLQEYYDKAGSEEPVIWFKQTIPHGCGSIAMLHCACNGAAVDGIIPGSDLARLFEDAIPLKMAERAELLLRSEPLYTAHESAARLGDTIAPDYEGGTRLGQHFVAFVKGKDGHLWELEGARKGPLDRGPLGKGEDALSTKALELGLGRLIDMERAAGGDLRFSCIALAPQVE